jgi:hypothetical protein
MALAAVVGSASAEAVTAQKRRKLLRLTPRWVRKSLNNSRSVMEGTPRSKLVVMRHCACIAVVGASQWQ